MSFEFFFWNERVLKSLLCAGRARLGGARGSVRNRCRPRRARFSRPAVMKKRRSFARRSGPYITLFPRGFSSNGLVPIEPDRWTELRLRVPRARANNPRNDLADRPERRVKENKVLTAAR